jgi:hypothetical protein
MNGVESPEDRRCRKWFDGTIPTKGGECNAARSDRCNERDCDLYCHPDYREPFEPRYCFPIGDRCDLHRFNHSLSMETLLHRSGSAAAVGTIFPKQRPDLLMNLIANLPNDFQWLSFRIGYRPVKDS